MFASFRRRRRGRAKRKAEEVEEEKRKEEDAEHGSRSTGIRANQKNKGFD